MSGDGQAAGVQGLSFEERLESRKWSVWSFDDQLNLLKNVAGTAQVAAATIERASRHVADGIAAPFHVEPATKQVALSVVDAQDTPPIVKVALGEYLRCLPEKYETLRKMANAEAEKRMRGSWFPPPSDKLSGEEWQRVFREAMVKRHAPVFPAKDEDGQRFVVLATEFCGMCQLQEERCLHECDAMLRVRIAESAGEKKARSKQHEEILERLDCLLKGQQENKATAAAAAAWGHAAATISARTEATVEETRGLWARLADWLPRLGKLFGGGQSGAGVYEVTQKEVAEKLGVDERTVKKWEAGKGKPPEGYSRDLRRNKVDFAAYAQAQADIQDRRQRILEAATPSHLGNMSGMRVKKDTK